MQIPLSFKSDRLHLQQLCASDDSFILELLNTAGWQKFIGNRNIHSLSDAAGYIEKINNNKTLMYWIVKLRESNTSIGIVTFIKRDYLAFHDIGFAFLPHFLGRGYAFEATKVLLDYIIQYKILTNVLATTVPENLASIKLLQKLGFTFEKTIEINPTTLSIYGVSIDKLEIDGVTKSYL